MQPLHLAPCMLEVEISPPPVGLQASMLVGVEQAVEVEACRPLILGLKDCLGVIQANLPNVPGKLAVGCGQFLRGGAQPTVRCVDLLDERVAGYECLLSSTPGNSTIVPTNNDRRRN
ncbi:MAG TPA: hypothetical protein VHM69_03735 [Rubrobacter sp.]|nr:hypothetical protein [Rubrobacter sp.]